MIVELNKNPKYHAQAGPFLVDLSCIATAEHFPNSGATQIVLKLQEIDNQECPMNYSILEPLEEVKRLMAKAGLLIQ